MLVPTPGIASGDGFRLRARASGETGVPLLFLHGFPFDSSQWKPQLEALASVAAMLAPDARGLGESEGPRNPLHYSMAVYADDACAWLDALDREKAVVAGLSMGGYVALEFALRHPDRLAALILMDTHPFDDTPETIRSRRTSQQAVATGGVAVIVDDLLERVLGYRTRHLKPEIAADVRAMISRAPPHGVIGALEAMARRRDTSPYLGEIDVPVLVVAGEEDLLTPPAQARTWVPALPVAVFETIPGAGHLVTLEAPQRVNTVIQAFVEGLGQVI